MKEECELVLSHYTNDDSSLRFLIQDIYNILVGDKKNRSELDAEEDSERTTFRTQLSKEEKPQKIFNGISNEFDVYLAEIVTDENDLSSFKMLKIKLRELFIEFERKINTLQNEIQLMKSRVSRLERMESDINAIHMENMGAQLRNKMIRFIKPNLSKRAARDEELFSLQGEERFKHLTTLIQNYEPNFNVFDLARSINAVEKNRVEKAHYEQPMTNDQIDSILNEFLSCNDQYLKEQAALVVRFLKILADHMHESPIVDLG